MSSEDRENGCLDKTNTAYETIPTKDECPRGIENFGMNKNGIYFGNKEFQLLSGGAESGILSEILSLLRCEYKEIRRELNFLALQSERMFSELSRLIRLASGEDQELDNAVKDDNIVKNEEISNNRVDFKNMMKYDRSFLARLIQSTDAQKEFYGRVRTSFLSYDGVNTNFSWGAERFNLGRQTIARFKIRGKTLCLYLALNPDEYKTTVFHHTDVSANKSMAGTPMLVKIKSPLGAKKAVRLVCEMLEKRGAVKKNKINEFNYSAAYPFETTEELIEEGLIKRIVNK